VKHGQTNGSAALNGGANESVEAPEETKDHRIDHDPQFEFGGSWGVSAMMLGFPL